MSIVRYNPFSELMNLRQSMDRFFEDNWFGPTGYLSAASDRLLPTVDVYQNKESITVKASLPGLKAEDVNVEINDGVLTIKGEMKSDEEVKEENYFYRERRCGSFNRSFRLPTGLQVEKADAIMEDGVLTVLIPKVEETKSKSIKINPKGKK